MKINRIWEMPNSKTFKIKAIKDLTLQDLVEYANYRCCDGNWSMSIALAVIDFLKKRPKLFKERWFKKHKWELFDKKNENRKINIDTGEWM